MAKAAIEVRPIAGAIGLQIFGADLGSELDAETVAAIRRAWLDHCVIFFRDQDLPPARFRLSPSASDRDRVSLHQGARGVPGDHPGGEARAREHQLRRHLALRHRLSEAPPMGTMLLAREVPPYGGDTMFANQYLAYEALSDGLKQTARRPDRRQHARPRPT